MGEVAFGSPTLPGDEEGPRLFDIPADRYTTREFMEAERDHLWPHVWLMAGYAFDVEKPGDYFVFEHGVESILVARDEDGRVGAFHNVCQHRGCTLKTAGRGHAESFRCPYHAWDWGLDGKLRDVPLGGEFQAGIPPNRRRLAPVACEVWAGLVWVCPGEPAVPLDEFLGTLKNVVGPYHLEDFRINADRTLLWDANWKTVIEGFNETYHVTAVHPQYLQSIDAERALWQFTPRHSLFIVPLGIRAPSATSGEIREPMAGHLRLAGLEPAAFTGRVPEARVALQKWLREDAARKGDDLSGLTEEQLTDTHEFHVFPNLQFDFHNAHEVSIHRYRPHPTDPNRCFFDVFSLARRGSWSERARPANRVFQPGEEQAGFVYNQDIAVLSRVQQGMRTRHYLGPLPSRLERRIPHMHEQIDRYLALHIPAAMRVTATRPDRNAVAP